MNPWLKQLDEHRQREGLPALTPGVNGPSPASADRSTPGSSRPPRRTVRAWYWPGSVLKVAIRLVTGEQPSSGCGCTDRAEQMNAWGWWGCWKQRKTIAGWLVEEARQRGHTLEADKALPLLLAAWREVRSRRRR